MSLCYKSCEGDSRPAPAHRRASTGSHRHGGQGKHQVDRRHGRVVEGQAMPPVTFQVLEGIDKGRVFRDLSTPVTIGREEGNVLRLNDERVSRFHAKVQFDNGEVIITDLESTNGTRVNGNVVQIRRLRAGDRIGVGRSLILFGSEKEIRERMETLTGGSASAPGGATRYNPKTLQSQTLGPDFPDELNLELS